MLVIMENTGSRLKLLVVVVNLQLSFLLQVSFNIGQYQSQPDNLVMPYKFKSLSLFISLEIHSLYGQEHRKFCICMTKCRAGFATDIGDYSLGSQLVNKKKAVGKGGFFFWHGGSWNVYLVQRGINLSTTKNGHK